MRVSANRTAVVVVAGLAAASFLAAQSGGFSPIPGGITPRTDVVVGEFSSPQMTVDVVLAPNNPSELSSLLANLYDPNSNSYHQWLEAKDSSIPFSAHPTRRLPQSPIICSQADWYWNNLRPRSWCARADRAAW